MSQTMFVATIYWNNGEPWGDNHHRENPTKVFETFKDADRYYRDKGYESIEVSDYAKYVAEYDVPPKEDVYIECPVGEDWRVCEQDYNEKYCDRCWNTNWDNDMNFSSETVRIYEVERWR